MKGETKLRVRYAETDKMGFVYYGNYATYYEVARVEALRNYGVLYSQLEKDGIMLPVLQFDIKFFKPAFYDDLLTIKSHARLEKENRIFFIQETYNEKNELINMGHVTLVAVDATTMKPTKLPQLLLQLFHPANN